MDGETNWSDTFTLDSEFHYIPGYWEWVKEVLSVAPKALKDAKAMLYMTDYSIANGPRFLYLRYFGEGMYLTRGHKKMYSREEEVLFGTQQWLIGLICTNCDDDIDKEFESFTL
ncbi:hypothetical protein HAX54_049011 [Datura stramonium]|uniref:Uncharacterized protein n=1 Tax=Datura stramonium TaxID=4076 RepID=A0ABS8SW16_DATST|nr:hypothetical protein [Datura stramonium]